MLKLEKVVLENFRCYKERSDLIIDDELTAIIGCNDAGKSSFFDALEIFFENQKIDQNDLNIVSDSLKEVSISCVFSNLPDSILIDADHKTTLKGEYLLNKNEMLEIKKIYDCNFQNPKINTFVICEHPTHENAKDLLSLNNSKLKKKAEQISVDLANVNKSINASIRKAIRESIKNDLKIKTQDISLDKDTGKDIWNKLKEELPIFFLFKVDRETTDQDSEAQDPMKAAVKEALKFQKNKLDDLAEEVKKEVKKIAEKTVDKIKEMDPSLANTLSPKFDNPKWDSVFKIRLNADDDIPLNKRGSGVRRLVLLNFFIAKSEIEVPEERNKGVIYAIEEPETNQHPNNQKKIINAFMSLAEKSDYQVLLTTHTPSMAKLLPDKNLRFIEVKEKSRIIHNTSNDRKLFELIAKALGVLPDHNVKLFIAVEGKNDISFLNNISYLFKKEDEESFLDLKELENKGEIIFFPIGGSNLALWASRLKELQVPEFHLYDRDVSTEEKFPKQSEIDKINERSGCKAFVTNKKEAENYISKKTIQKEVKDKYNIKISLEIDDFIDVPEWVAKKIYEEKEEKIWDDLSPDKKKGKEQKIKNWLNRDVIKNMNIGDLDENTKKEIRTWLDSIKQLYCSQNSQNKY